MARHRVQSGTQDCSVVPGHVVKSLQMEVRTSMFPLLLNDGQRPLTDFPSNSPISGAEAHPKHPRDQEAR